MNVTDEVKPLTGAEYELIIDDWKFVKEFKTPLKRGVTLRNLYKTTISNPGGHLNFGCMSDFR